MRVWVASLFALGLTACIVENDRVHQGLRGPEQAYSHRGEVGTLARELLNEEVFKKLVVELLFVDGYRPTQEAIRRLQQFLEERLKKPKGIRVIEEFALPSPGKTHYTVGDARQIEDLNRRYFTRKDEIAVTVLFLDGASSDGAVGTLGQAHRSTSIVIYEKALLEASGAGGARRDLLESAILHHEFGHLLGMVQQGEPSREGHRDSDHGDHCANPLCLMHYSVQTGLAGSGGTQVPALDESCLADLRALGGR